ncbi:MAG TPA: hypothetical protein VKE98_02695 [Gemmataceae bacterium]|nr:hypothetical protein [Gemmataceae bacterium]
MVLLASAFLTLACPCAAQTTAPREDILRLVPPDTGVCLVVSDLRGHWPKVRDAAWIKNLRESSLGKVLAADPQMARLRQVDSDLKKHLDVDVAQLRDDILGDLMVFAYKPAPPGQSKDEQGLVLLWARKPDLLAQIVKRLNEAQLNKELKEVVAVDYLGSRYFRRVERTQTHFYFLDGSLFAYTSQEAIIRQVIERHKKKDGDSQLGKRLDRAGAGSALASLWVNPRAFDADLKYKAKDAKDAQEVLVLKTFLSYWQALDGIILSVSLADHTAIRFTLQARVPELPKAIKPLFTESSTTSELWSRFPQKAIFRMVNRVNAAELVDALAELTPPAAKQVIAEKVQVVVRAFLQLDLVKDVLPNIGPDWGVCIAAGPAKNDCPHVLAALAVRPGSGEVAVDQALITGIRQLANIGILPYNLKYPADPIRLEKLKQGRVEIQYLVNDKVFPPGLQPAFALKDGYLLLASSPEAIAQFQKTAPPAFPRGETPLMELSLRELGQFLKVRRQKVVGYLSSQSQISEETAGQLLDGLLAAFDLFDRVLLSERRQTGQVTWTLRLGNGGSR